jgi:hypothetical protein
VIRSKLLGRMRLQPPTPEVLAALSAIGSSWRNDPEAKPVIELAARSRLPEIRGAVSSRS